MEQAHYCCTLPLHSVASLRRPTAESRVPHRKLHLGCRFDICPIPFRNLRLCRWHHRQATLPQPKWSARCGKPAAR